MSEQPSLRFVLVEHSQEDLRMLREYVDVLSKDAERVGFRINPEIDELKTRDQIKEFAERLERDSEPPCDVILSDIFFPEKFNDDAAESYTGPGDWLFHAIEKRQVAKPNERPPLLVFVTNEPVQGAIGFGREKEMRVWRSQMPKPVSTTMSEGRRSRMNPREWLNQLALVVSRHIGRAYASNTIDNPTRELLLHAMDQAGYRQVRADLERVERSIVVFQGDIGTGKDWYAKELHLRLSRGESKPFKPMNLTPGLVNLSIHILGAPGQKGLLLDAKNGTLFIDSISESWVDEVARLLASFDPNENIFRLESGPLSFGGRIILGDESPATSGGRSQLEDALNSQSSLEYTKIVFPPLSHFADYVPRLAHDILKIYKQSSRVEQFSRDVEEWLKSVPWSRNAHGLHDIMQWLAKQVGVLPMSPITVEELERAMAAGPGRRNVLDAPGPRGTAGSLTVTLEQFATVVGRPRSTLEKKKPLPAPVTKGAGRAPSFYKYQDLVDWLVKLGYSMPNGDPLPTETEARKALPPASARS